MSKLVSTIQDEGTPVEKEALAQAIIDISNSFKKLLKSGLNRKAVVILVASDSQQPQYIVSGVLDSLESLAKTYTR